MSTNTAPNTSIPYKSEPQTVAKSKANWLGRALLTVRVATASAEVVPFPYVKGVFATITTVLEAIQKVRKSRDILKELCEDIAEITTIVLFLQNIVATTVFDFAARLRAAGHVMLWVCDFALRYPVPARPKYMLKLAGFTCATVPPAKSARERPPRPRSPLFARSLQVETDCEPTEVWAPRRAPGTACTAVDKKYYLGKMALELGKGTNFFPGKIPASIFLR
ncbi:hypothetical protein GGX14DRAFT_662635 [Mycena pura]|uniref:Uncharacterized protein n=1 Tax=Mycena pura TaxID=153505 RepID=A0AAD6YHJ8_9AGAR|nr:hypothetical protein GGX14DRAFT_662635 [Mycena pura]